MISEILIGTSGYDHPELRGSFYPQKLARKNFLEFYSTKFNALEINSTFYGMPTEDRMFSFYERSGGRVKFSVKLTRVLTHEIDRNWVEYADLFKNALKPLIDKDVLSTVLIQFPESFKYTKENRIYLSKLLEKLSMLPAVVEFRHRDWIRPSVFEGLEKRKTGIVFCDMPALKNLPDGTDSGTPFIGPEAYIRLHGRNADAWYSYTPIGEEPKRYDYDYSIKELESFLPVIKNAIEANRRVHMYFNNHPKGIGFRNAMEMKKLIDERFTVFLGTDPNTF